MKKLITISLLALATSFLPSCTTVVEDRDPAVTATTSTTQRTVTAPAATTSTTVRTGSGY